MAVFGIASFRSHLPRPSRISPYIQGAALTRAGRGGPTPALSGQSHKFGDADFVILVWMRRQVGHIRRIAADGGGAASGPEAFEVTVRDRRLARVFPYYSLPCPRRVLASSGQIVGRVALIGLPLRVLTFVNRRSSAQSRPLPPSSSPVNPRFSQYFRGFLAS